MSNFKVSSYITQKSLASPSYASVMLLMAVINIIALCYLFYCYYSTCIMTVYECKIFSLEWGKAAE